MRFSTKILNFSYNEIVAKQRTRIVFSPIYVYNDGRCCFLLVITSAFRKEKLIMTKDEFDSWLGYCQLGEPDYPMCLRQMEMDDDDIIWKEDEGNTGRGRAFRRKMFFTKEKNKKNQAYRMHVYCNNEKFVRKHYSEIMAEGFTGIDTNLYSIRVLEKEERKGGKMLVLVQNHVNKTESVFVFQYNPSPLEELCWWKPLRQLPDNGFKAIYYKRFYPNCKGVRRIANKKARHYHVYAEDGEDISYPKKSKAHRKVFDSYDICEY